MFVSTNSHNPMTTIIHFPIVDVFFFYKDILIRGRVRGDVKIHWQSLQILQWSSATKYHIEPCRVCQCLQGLPTCYLTFKVSGICQISQTPCVSTTLTIFHTFMKRMIYFIEESSKYYRRYTLKYGNFSMRC